MLVSPGQPVEVLRDLVDVDGDPFDPQDLPGAVAISRGRTWPDLAPVVLSAQCVVRQIKPGRYAARIPAAVLATIGPADVVWTWEDVDEQTATDDVEVTPRGVATLGDLAALPGKKAAETIGLQARLRALSAATRDFETATNQTFTPRLVRERRPWPGPLPGADDVLGSIDVAADPDGTHATLTYATGRLTPPEDVSRAVAILASSYMADGPWDDRGYAITDDGGGVRLLTAGVGRAMFSIPPVEAAARRWRIPAFA